MDREKGRQYFGRTNDFGDQLYNVLNSIGQNGPFHRLPVV
jgi:hypothetical protein